MFNLKRIFNVILNITQHLKIQLRFTMEGVSFKPDYVIFLKQNFLKKYLKIFARRDLNKNTSSVNKNDTVIF